MSRKIDFEVLKPKPAVAVEVKTPGPKAAEVYLPGKPGKAGEPGNDGHTPVRGVDYFTEADKQDFLASVKNSLSAETWVFTLEDGSTVEKQVLVK